MIVSQIFAQLENLDWESFYEHITKKRGKLANGEDAN